MVLAFLLHFYVHSIPPSDDNEAIRIPRAICIPLVEVSHQLGTAPVLTFADVVLWNYDLVDPSKPLSAENIRYINLLSGTDAEREFYVSSGAIELKGVEMLQIIETFMSLPNVTETTSVTKISRDLAQLKTIIDDMTETFRAIRETVDPQDFYWKCRPWWNGAPSDCSRPQWVFEGVTNSALVDTSGPSAGQSTVMHALDIFLDVDHKLLQKRTPAPSPENRRADTGFMARMRRYMPGLHRDYLARIGAVSRTLREVALSTPSLQEPYNEAVEALKKLRDVHIRIVCLYVVSMAHAKMPEAINMRREESSVSRGTGGNEVSNLLKAGRDATRRAMIKP